MKKLIFVFLVLTTLVVIAGCQARRSEETVHFDPDVETGTTVTVDGQAKDPLSIGTTKADDSVEAAGPDLAVTSLDTNLLETTSGYHVIRGTAPRQTAKVMINDYTLRRYYPGQTLWSYITSTSIGTLRTGENNYTVRAFDADDNEIDAVDFTIFYNPPEVPNLPSTGIPFWLIALFSLMMAASYFAFRLSVR